jgi:hypothetical protein
MSKARYAAAGISLAAVTSLALTGCGGGGAFDAATGAVLRTFALSNRTNAPVTIDGDYLITAASVLGSAKQHVLIIAYKLGGTGKLPHPVTVQPRG